MKEQVIKLIKETLDDFEATLPEAEIRSLVEIPPSTELGDFAFPCFQLAKLLKDNPHDIALQVREKMTNLPGEFEDVKVIGPYLNFFMNRKN